MYPSCTTWNIFTLCIYTDCMLIPIITTCFIDDKTSIRWGPLLSHVTEFMSSEPEFESRGAHLQISGTFKIMSTMVSFAEAMSLNTGILFQEGYAKTQV